MNSSCVCQVLRKGQHIKFRSVFTYLLILMLIILASYYYSTKRYASQEVISKQYSKNISNVESKPIFSMPNGFNSCPKQFRTHQPLFPWMPRMTCDIKCAASALQAVLPTAPWFDENYKRFSNFSIGSRPEKWFNLVFELERTASRLSEVTLFPPTKRKFHLDIGTGFGYLPFFSSHFNNCVIGTNLYTETLNYEMKLFRNATDILGVDVRPLQILPMTSIPIDLFDGIKFDIITVYLGWFHCKPRTWELPEWIFFLTDIASHHTADNAHAYFDLNRCNDNNGKRIDSLWSNETMSILERKGVQFINKHVGSTRMTIMDLTVLRSESEYNRKTTTTRFNLVKDLVR